jgi:hypothetical protein
MPVNDEAHLLILHHDLDPESAAAMQYKHPEFHEALSPITLPLTLKIRRRLIL